ncbi:hypothetical protein [Phaffia rhodozyma]|uniref:DUF676 domain-containing protein n=1 Tax=Phaffia rhodozyma TaxID=264483 RepID=A0A0F7SHI6_PHARH|nr:hypothetical protein [Phaffia rhodozyma]
MASSANDYREDFVHFNTISCLTQLKAEKITPEPTFRDYPFSLMKSDLLLIWKYKNLFWQLISLKPSITTESTLSSREFSKVRAITPTTIGEQFLLTVGSLIAICAVFWSSVVSGVLGLLTLASSVGLFMLYLSKCQPGVVITSKYQPTSNRDDEEWFFINGICTGNEGLQRDIDFMAQMQVASLSSAMFFSLFQGCVHEQLLDCMHRFDRPITGVHNKTNGFILDIIECIIQRDFAYTTQDGTLELYDRLKRALLDANTKRVVLLAHSQGGIISSLILDYLLSDIPQVFLQKLETYTFGNAANHFNSPVTTPSRDHEGSPVVKHIEHYANGHDFVARIGVLNWDVPASDRVDTRFYGRLFSRPDKSGHLLVENYFESNWNPSSFWLKSTDGQPSRLWSYLNGGTPDDFHINGFTHDKI